MNPPHSGHVKVVNKLREEAQREGAVVRLFLSHSQDNERNPLDPETKLGFVKRLFPDIDVRLSKTIFTASLEMASEGIDEGFLIVGEDRQSQFSAILERYAGTPELGLKHAEVRSISRDTEDASATRARQAVIENDWLAFKQLSASDDDELTLEMYNAVRAAMGVL
ncbi:unnamed protein product [Sphagnum tenellum]